MAEHTMPAQRRARKKPLVAGNRMRMDVDGRQCLSTLLTGLISVKQPSAKRDNLSIQTVSTLIDFC